MHTKSDGFIIFTWQTDLRDKDKKYNGLALNMDTGLAHKKSLHAF